MFTGIIEDIGTVTHLKNEGTNMHITVSCTFTDELKIDQSVAHNGVCLTVVAKEQDQYTVTAIDETLIKSNLGGLTTGARINLERGMKLGDRLDGHIVQGHVDQIGIRLCFQQTHISMFETQGCFLQSSQGNERKIAKVLEQKNL